MKYFLLFLLSFSANAQSPWYYGSGEAVNLENGIKYKNGIKNIAGALDPSATAVNAPIGSLYESTNGNLYVKKDARITTNWAIQLDAADLVKIPNTFAGFDSLGSLYSLPTYNFIPYINGLASSMTTDGSTKTNIEKLYFSTTFGDGVSGDITNYTDLYFNNITNANFAIDYYRSFASYFNAANGVSVLDVSLVDTGYGGLIGNTFKGFNSYYAGDNGGSVYGFQFDKSGNTLGDSYGVNIGVTGSAVNYYGFRSNMGGAAGGQIEQISLSNTATSGGNYFGINDNQQGNIAGSIFPFNSSNQGSFNSYTGLNLTNSGVASNYTNGVNFYNNSLGTANSLTMFQGGNDANIGTNLSGINLTNNGSANDINGINFSNGTSGSAVNFQGISLNNQAPTTGSLMLANLYSSGDGVQSTGINVSLEGNHTTSITGMQINVNNATHPNTIQPVGLTINGALNVSSTLTTGIDPVGMASSLNSVGGSFTVASGSALSGGEFVFGNNLAPVMNFNDNMGEDATTLDLGFAAVGFVGSLIVDAGKTVNDINMALAGAGNPSGSGVVDNMTMYYAAGILPQGGSVTANNMYGFKTSPVLCAVAGNCWGLMVQDTSAQNYVDRLAISTLNKKVSSSDIGLELYKKAVALGRDSLVELNAMTATEGAIAYNSDSQKPSYFNGTIWQDVGTGTGYALPSLTTGSALFYNGTDIAEDNTNFFWNDSSNYLKIKNAIEIGSVDAFSRTQIWNAGTNASIRLGALAQDGDPVDVHSEGIVAYGPNSQGTAINSGTGNFGYARIKADRIGLLTSINNVQDYYFRADPTELYLKNDSSTKTFKVARLTGVIDTTMTTGIVHSDASGILTSMAIDLASADVSGLLPQANGGLGSTTPGAINNVLTSNGTSWISSPVAVPLTVYGSTGSPVNIIAANGFNAAIITSFASSNIVFAQGNGGAVNISAADQIIDGTAVGQEIKIIGRSATNTIQMNDGNNLKLNGIAILGLNDYIQLIWDGTDWIEQGRNF